MGLQFLILCNVGFVILSLIFVRFIQPYRLASTLDPWHSACTTSFSTLVDLATPDTSPLPNDVRNVSKGPAASTGKSALAVAPPESLAPAPAPAPARAPILTSVEPAESAALATAPSNVPNALPAPPAETFPVAKLGRDLACAGFHSPSVAICIHGSARSFTHLIVHRALKENLLDPLAANATVFAHITRLDSRGDPFHKYNGLFEPPTEANIRRVAASLAVAPTNLVVLEGPNVDLPTCPSYEDNFRTRRNVTSRNPNYHVYSMDHLLSLAGQISHRHGCMELIRRHEESAEQKFEYVISARADLSVYIPMAPSCLFDPSQNYGLGDWFFSTTREAADILNWEPYEQFYNCSKNLRLGGNVDEYIAPFQKRIHMAGYPWTVMIVRENGPRFPTGMCNRFHNPVGLPQDPSVGEPECKRFTSSNPFNREEVEGEALPDTVAQMSCASHPRPRVAVCLHGPLKAELPVEVSLLRDQHFWRPLGANVTTFLHLVPAGGEEAQQGEELRKRLRTAPDHAKFPAAEEAGMCGRQPQAVSQLQWHRDECLNLIEGSGQAFDLVVTLRSSVVPVVGLKPYCMYNLKQPRRYLDLAYAAPPTAFRSALDRWKATCGAGGGPGPTPSTSSSSSSSSASSSSSSLNETMGEDFVQDDGFAMGYYSPTDPCLLFRNLPRIYREPWSKLPSQIRSNPFNPKGPAFTCNGKTSKV